MLTQYEILTLCLSELKKSHLPVIDKLRLEVLMIQAKRLLLDDDICDMVRGVIASEREFSGLYHQVRQVCAEEAESSAVGGLLDRLQQIKENLKVLYLGRSFGAFM